MHELLKPPAKGSHFQAHVLIDGAISGLAVAVDELARASRAFKVLAKYHPELALSAADAINLIEQSMAPFLKSNATPENIERGKSFKALEEYLVNHKDDIDRERDQYTKEFMADLLIAKTDLLGDFDLDKAVKA
jgi:hypothetical protein